MSFARVLLLLPGNAFGSGSQGEENNIKSQGATHIHPSPQSALRGSDSTQATSGQATWLTHLFSILREGTSMTAEKLSNLKPTSSCIKSYSIKLMVQLIVIAQCHMKDKFDDEYVVKYFSGTFCSNENKVINSCILL